MTDLIAHGRESKSYDRTCHAKHYPCGQLRTQAESYNRTIRRCYSLLRRKVQFQQQIMVALPSGFEGCHLRVCVMSVAMTTPHCLGARCLLADYHVHCDVVIFQSFNMRVLVTSRRCCWLADCHVHCDVVIFQCFNMRVLVTSRRCCLLADCHVHCDVVIFQRFIACAGVA